MIFRAIGANEVATVVTMKLRLRRNEAVPNGTMKFCDHCRKVKDISIYKLNYPQCAKARFITVGYFIRVSVLHVPRKAEHFFYK